MYTPKEQKGLLSD